MDKEYYDYVKIFNSEVNQKISKFGVIPEAFIELEDNPKLLFYYYPMIERLVRCLLNMSGVFDIMNSNQYTFKTLYSIIINNESGLSEVFGQDFGEEIYCYIVATYSPQGFRNKIMHYSEGEVNLSVVASAKYMFLRLVQFYVESFTVAENT